MSAQTPKGPPIDAGYRAGDRLDANALAPVGVLLGIAIITTALRIYWRVKPTWRIGLDDHTLVFALVRRTLGTIDLTPRTCI